MKKNKKYTDILSMVQSLSSNEFNLQFLLYLIQKEFKQRDSTFKKCLVEKYQENFRYYFDENTIEPFTTNEYDTYFFNKWIKVS
jgi:hypothetical protein